MINSMLRRLCIGLVFFFMLIATFVSVAQAQERRAPMGFCCSMNYPIANHTKKGAEVTISRRSILKSGHLLTYQAWIPAGGRTVVRLKEDNVYYDLRADFKANGEGSKTIGTATQWWKLANGSKDKLIEGTGGQFHWAPGN